MLSLWDDSSEILFSLLVLCLLSKIMGIWTQYCCLQRSTVGIWWQDNNFVRFIFKIQRWAIDRLKGDIVQFQYIVLFGYIIFVFHLHCSFLDGVTQALCSYLPKIPAFELLRSVYYLSVLGCFPSAPLQQLMNEDTINQLKATGESQVFTMMEFSQMLFIRTDNGINNDLNSQPYFVGFRYWEIWIPLVVVCSIAWTYTCFLVKIYMSDIWNSCFY